VTIDGNVFEYNWVAAQQGQAILFTVRNQSGRAPWSVVRDVTFTNNTVRHVAAAIYILGRDDRSGYTSQQARNITIRNNLFEDLDNAFGNTGRFLEVSESPAGVVVDHNTIDNEGTVVEAMSGATSGFVFTNNIARHNSYGVKGQGTASGNQTLAKYFPGAVFKGNVLAGGPASSYPAGNFFPPSADFLAQFVSPSTGNWQLASASTYNNRATDGTDVGFNLGSLLIAQRASTWTSSASGGSTPPPPPAPAPAPQPTVNQPPVANTGGPYTAAAGTATTVNGSASADAEAPLVRYDWHFGEDIVLRAADVPAANFRSTRFRRVSVSSAAGGIAIENPNWGEARRTTAYSTPNSYVELTFEAASGVPYWIWVRLRASGNSSSNDSLHVQFDRSVNASGAAIHRIGTRSSMPVILQNCTGSTVSGWGWNDGGSCGLGAPVYFQAAGRQRLRIQQREDGVMFDQIVISSNVYSGRSPGLARADTTIVPTTLGADTGITAVHAWRRRGTYPLRLWVTDSVGQDATAATTVMVR
jgi:hypothetical protein